MAEVVKKVPRKLRGREVIMVDEQILRRRKMLREKGIDISKFKEARAKQREYDRKVKAEARALKADATKKDFFG